MNELQKSFIQNGPSFLIHYNHNHDPKTGRFSSSTLFVSGSSKTQNKDSEYYRHKLPKQVRKELDIAMDMKDRIVVGDAPGVDRQVQDYLKNKKYKNVEIFGPGKQVRYSADPEWKTNAIDSKYPEGSKEWLAEKDKVMAKKADKGIAVILDEGSRATKANIDRLIDKVKPENISVFQLSKDGIKNDRKVTDYVDKELNKTPYEMAKDIFNSLSDSEKKNLTTNGEFTNSDLLVTRKVVNRKSFAEIERDPDNSKIGYISTATKPEYRGSGYSDSAVAAALESAKQAGLREVYWETTTSNKASSSAAQKFGFEKAKNYSKGDSNWVYKFSNHESPYIEHLLREKKKYKDPELRELIDMEIEEIKESGYWGK